MALRHAARIDANQPAIIKLFRKLGATVYPTHTLKGFVDIVVGYRGRNYLIEIKDGAKAASARQLTADEKEFHDTWRGSAHVIETESQVFELMESIKKGEL